MDSLFADLLHDGHGKLIDAVDTYCLLDLISDTDSPLFVKGPIIGLLYDKFGPRYLIIGGTFLHVFGLMMTSISDQYYQILLSQGVCSAIGVSAIFQPGKFVSDVLAKQI